MKDISLSIDKVDNISKISGTENYIADIQFENMYHAKTVRSTICKGKIKNVIYPKLPEDYYIIDASDIPGENFVKVIFEDMPVFAKDKVTY